MNQNTVNNDGADNGKWRAATLGQFVAWLIDTGVDDSILFRVMDAPPDELGKFVRHIEVYSVPNGQVVTWINAIKPEGGVEKSLAALIEAGLVR